MPYYYFITMNMLSIYEKLHKAYGLQHWWPGDSALEVIIGAILTQNTAWTNVEKAIRNLKDEGLISGRRLKEIREGALARFIRPAGYYNIKARRLKNFIAFLYSEYGGRLKNMAAEKDTGRLRNGLLGVNGIGCETADSILLYAFNRPIFVVDAYTKRIFSRHGAFEEDASYEDVQRFFMAALPKSARLFNEFHALVVKLGKDVCRKAPRCGVCPLRRIRA